MITSDQEREFCARVDELNQHSPYIPPDVLALRLVRLIVGLCKNNADWPRVVGLKEALEGLVPATIESAAGPGVEHYQQLAEERYDRIRELEEELDQWRNPGVPAAGASPPPVSTSDPEVFVGWAHQAETQAAATEAQWEAVEWSEENPAPDPKTDAGGEDEDPETEKTCKLCGETKAVSEFYKHPAFADGRDNRCKQCRSRLRKKKKAAKKQGEEKPQQAPGEASGGEPPPQDQARKVTSLPRAERAPEPEKKPRTGKDGAAARRCASGEGCVHFEALGEAPKLSAGNKGDVCFACEERDREMGLSGRIPLVPIVRKSADGTVRS